MHMTQATSVWMKVNVHLTQGNETGHVKVGRPSHLPWLITSVLLLPERWSCPGKSMSIRVSYNQLHVSSFELPSIKK